MITSPSSGQRLTFFFALAIVLVIAAGLILASFLDYANFRRAYDDLMTSRVLVPVQDARHMIEYGMDLGLDPGSLTTLEVLLRETLDHEPDLAAILVEGRNGRLQLEVSRPATPLPADLRSVERVPGPDGRYWSAVDAPYYLIGMPLVSSFGQSAGNVILVFDRAALQRPLEEMAERLSATLGQVLLLVALVTIAGLWWLLRPFRREMAAAERLAAGAAPGQVDVAGRPLLEDVALIMAVRPGGMPVSNTPQRDEKTDRGLFNRVLLFALLLTLLAITLVSLQGMRDFRAEFEPALHSKANTLGDSIVRLLAGLERHGIGPADLANLAEHLVAIRSAHPDVSYLIVTDPEGRPWESAGVVPSDFALAAGGGLAAGTREARISTLDGHLDTAIPVLAGQRLLARVHVGQERAFVDRRISEARWDLATAALLSLLIVFELLLFSFTFLYDAPKSAIHRLADAVRRGEWSARIRAQGQGGFGRLARLLNGQLDAVTRAAGVALAPKVYVSEERTRLVRWPFFLFVFAEALSLSFLPLYVEQLYVPIAGLERELVLGLPISVFMMVWALSLPFAGAWSDRRGRRFAFVVGAGLAALGFVLTSASQNIWDLLLWRSLTAVGYGIVFVTAQGYVVDYTLPHRRTQGMAMFLAAFFGGSMCGTAIGGILVAYLGYAPVFVLSAVLALTAAGVAALFMLAPSGLRAGAGQGLSLGALAGLFRNARFLALVAFAAIPSKLLLTGFLYYAMPLYLSSVALNPGDRGRVMMGYGLAMILLTPLAARLADAWQQRSSFVAVGGGLAACAVFVTGLEGSVLIAVAGVLLLGAAQALSGSTQLSLVLDVTRGEAERLGSGTVMGLYRLLERVGNVLGPVMVALLIGLLGFHGAFEALAYYVLGSALLFMGIWLGASRRQRRLAAAGGPTAAPGGRE